LNICQIVLKLDCNVIANLMFDITKKTNTKTKQYKCDSEIPKPSLTDEERIEALFLAIIFTSALPIMIAYFAHSAVPHKCFDKLNILCTLPPGYFLMYLSSIILYVVAYAKFGFRYIAKQNLKTPSMLMIVAIILYILTFILALIPAFFYKVA